MISFKRNKPIQWEHMEQAALLQWCMLHEFKYPALRMLYAIPNGGDRNPVVAAKLKEEGVKRGVPDLHLPVARGHYHSLYIEMKRPDGGGLSQDQKQWVKDLIGQGNLVVVCHGWESASEILVGYLNNQILNHFIKGI